MFSFQCYKLDPLNKSMTHSLNTEQLKISMADSCNCGKQVILLVPGNKKKKNLLVLGNKKSSMLERNFSEFQFQAWQ